MYSSLEVPQAQLQYMQWWWHLSRILQISHDRRVRRPHAARVLSKQCNVATSLAPKLHVLSVLHYTDSGVVFLLCDPVDVHGTGGVAKPLRS